MHEYLIYVYIKKSSLKYDDIMLKYIYDWKHLEKLF